MIRKSLLTGSIVALVGAMLTASATAKSNGPPADFRLEITANFIAQHGTWVSSGAFSDEGTLEGVQREGSGATESLHETLQGAQGSFTLEITKALTPIPGQTPLGGYTGANDHGHWRILDGTGAYSGISGQGQLDGTVDFVTGDINDTLTGTVRL